MYIDTERENLGLDAEIYQFLNEETFCIYLDQVVGVKFQTDSLWDFFSLSNKLFATLGGWQILLLINKF